MRVFLSHLFLAHFLTLVRESPPLSLFSCSLPHFVRDPPLSLPLHISSFWSERVLLSHLFLAHFLILVRESPPLSLFLAHFLILVRESPPLSLFSCSLPHFGQRESSSLTFFLLTSSLWSERALLSHFSLTYFLLLAEPSSLTFLLHISSFWLERTLFGLSSCKGMSEKGKSIEIRKLKMLIYQHS